VLEHNVSLRAACGFHLEHVAETSYRNIFLMPSVFYAIPCNYRAHPLHLAREVLLLAQLCHKTQAVFFGLVISYKTQLLDAHK